MDIEKMNFAEIELHCIAAQFPKNKTRFTTKAKQLFLEQRSLFRAISFNFIYGFVKRNKVNG